MMDIKLFTIVLGVFTESRFSSESNKYIFINVIFKSIGIHLLFTKPINYDKFKRNLVPHQSGCKLTIGRENKAVEIGKSLI